MTETQKTLQLLEETEQIIQELLEFENDEFKKGLEDYILLKKNMEVLLSKTAKYKKFIAIKDPSTQIYGPKMLEKMNIICQRFEKIDEIFEEQLIPIFESIELDYKKKLFEMEQEERRKKEEDFRRKVEEGIQETYLEEKRRLDMLKKRTEESEKIRRELNHLNLEEHKRNKEIDSVIKDIVFLLGSMEKELKDEFTHLDLNLKFIEDGIRQLLTDSILKDFYLCLSLISDLVGAIIRDPSDIKFRLIRLKNENFFKSFGNKKGCFLIFFGIGFRIINENERKKYFDVLSSNKELNLNIHFLNSNEIYLVLREPDPIDEFDLWIIWMDKLIIVNNIIKEIIKLKFDQDITSDVLNSIIGKIIKITKEEFFIEKQKLR